MFYVSYKGRIGKVSIDHLLDIIIKCELEVANGLQSQIISYSSFGSSN